MLELQGKPLYKVLSDGTHTYKVRAKSPIEHPLSQSNKGCFSVDCTLDIRLVLIRMNMSPICY